MDDAGRRRTLVAEEAIREKKDAHRGFRGVGAVRVLVVRPSWVYHMGQQRADLVRQ